MNEDRITALPDPLLDHILSFLGPKQIVQSSTLSKSWKHLWKNHIFDRDICNKRSDQKTMKEKLYVFVNRAALVINNLYLSASSCYSEKPITEPVTQNHQFINIRNMPPSLAAKVKRLHLGPWRYPWFAPRDGDLNIKSNTLESLIIEDYHFWGSNCLTISAPQLRYLKVQNYGEHFPKWCSIKICAPRLTLLIFEGYLHHYCILDDLPGLAIAEIDTKKYTDGNFRRSEPRFPEKEFFGSMSNLFKAVRKVKSLTLSLHGIQSFRGTFPNIRNGTAILFRKLKHLKLEEWYPNAYIHSTAKLLKSFPNLETLVLERTKEDLPLRCFQTLKSFYEPRAEKEDLREQLSFNCFHFHLKTIEIRYVTGSENELKFVEFLLRNAMVLEKINITSRNYEKLLEFKDKIKQLPKGSSSVAVLLNSRRET